MGHTWRSTQGGWLHPRRVHTDNMQVQWSVTSPGGKTVSRDRTLNVAKFHEVRVGNCRTSKLWLAVDDCEGLLGGFVLRSVLEIMFRTNKIGVLIDVVNDYFWVFGYTEAKRIGVLSTYWLWI